MAITEKQGDTFKPAFFFDSRIISGKSENISENIQVIPSQSFSDQQPCRPCAFKAVTMNRAVTMSCTTEQTELWVSGMI